MKGMTRIEKFVKDNGWELKGLDRGETKEYIPQARRMGLNKHYRYSVIGDDEIMQIEVTKSAYAGYSYKLLTARGVSIGTYDTQSAIVGAIYDLIIDPQKFGFRWETNKEKKQYEYVLWYSGEDDKLAVGKVFATISFEAVETLGAKRIQSMMAQIPNHHRQ